MIREHTGQVVSLYPHPPAKTNPPNLQRILQILNKTSNLFSYMTDVITFL